MWTRIFTNKYAFWAIIVIILIIIGLIAKGTIQGWIRQIKLRNRDKEILDKAENQADPKNLSYTSDTYDRYANRIHEAIDNGWYNVNEPRVINVFKKLKNSDDVAQLITAFGRRDSQTLSGWIYWGLNEDEVAQINSILKNKGIGYRF